MVVACTCQPHKPGCCRFHGHAAVTSAPVRGSPPASIMDIFGSPGGVTIAHGIAGANTKSRRTVRSHFVDAASEASFVPRLPAAPRRMRVACVVGTSPPPQDSRFRGNPPCRLPAAPRRMRMACVVGVRFASQEIMPIFLAITWGPFPTARNRFYSPPKCWAGFRLATCTHTRARTGGRGGAASLQSPHPSDASARAMPGTGKAGTEALLDMPSPCGKQVGNSRVRLDFGCGGCYNTTKIAAR